MGVIGVPLAASTEEIGESDMTKNAQIPDSRIYLATGALARIVEGLCPKYH